MKRLRARLAHILESWSWYLERVAHRLDSEEATLAAEARYDAIVDRQGE